MLWNLFIKPPNQLSLELGAGDAAVGLDAAAGAAGTGTVDVAGVTTGCGAPDGGATDGVDTDGVDTGGGAEAALRSVDGAAIVEGVVVASRTGSRTVSRVVVGAAGGGGEAVDGEAGAGAASERGGVIGRAGGGEAAGMAGVAGGGCWTPGASETPGPWMLPRISG